MRKMVCAVAVIGLFLLTPAAYAQLDHMLCYKMTDTFEFTEATTVDMVAGLQPEFTQNGCAVVKPVAFCVPASKTVTAGSSSSSVVGTPLQNDYICYEVKCPTQVEPAAKVVTDQFGTHDQTNYRPATICVPAAKAPVECQAGANARSAAMCNGVCPDPTETCQYERPTSSSKSTGTCICAPPPKECKGNPNSAGMCGGTCSVSGQVCLPESVTTTTGTRTTTTVECKCQTPPPPSCGLESTGTCGGVCPSAADQCSLDATGQCTCQPANQPCAGVNGVCGGICQLPGQQCHPDATGACTCTTPCGQNPLTGQCSGECTTAGDVCALTAAGCECVPPSDAPCNTVNGSCNGTCPVAGQDCEPDSTGACSCQPPVSPCSMASGQCGGVCPSGSTCQLNTTVAPSTCGCVAPTTSGPAS